MESLLIIAGPTASGKSDYAVSWALKHSAEILSCDSLAIYKGMDIGTAKPSPAQQSLVPHWGINLIYPNEKFSVYDYQQYAYKKVLEILGRGNRVLVVGGSGFYLKSFLGPVVDELSDTTSVNLQVEQWLKAYGNEYLLKKLITFHKDKLPEWFDDKNHIKVQKALIRCLASGLTMTELRERFESSPYPFKEFSKKTILISRPLEVLKCKAQTRINSMFTQGLVTEVKGLLNNNLLIPNTPPAQSVGYREIIRFLQSNEEKNEKTGDTSLREEIFSNTLTLIKKQNTWFRHQIRFDRRLYF